MRQHFVPLTFGKPDSSDQFNIVAKEAACAYIRTLEHNFGRSGQHNNMITVVGWGNGLSSTVTLMLTTEMHDISFDLVAAYPTDLKRYHAKLSVDQRQMTGFVHLCGNADPVSNADVEDEDDEQTGHIAKLTSYVMHLIQIQLCVAWWILRVFCLTSTTNSSLIKLFARKIDVEHPRRKDFETVLRFTSNLSLLPCADDDCSVSGDDADDDDRDEGSSTEGVALYLSADHKSFFLSILQHLNNE